MTFEQAFLLWSAAPVLFVIGGLLLMCLACYLTCVAMHLWHRLRKWSSKDDGYKTLCERISTIAG